MQLFHQQTGLSANAGQLWPYPSSAQEPQINKLHHNSLQHIIELASLGTWEFDTDDGMVNGCIRFRQLLNISTQLPVSAISILRKISIPQREAFQEAVTGSLMGQDLLTEIKLNGPEPVWLKITGRLYRIEENNTCKLVGIIEDITRQKLQEENKNDMIAYLSHELRSPLTCLKLYIQRAAQLAKENRHDLIYTFLTKADEQVTSMNTLANTYLNQTSIENGIIELNYSSFDLVKLLKDLTLDLGFQNPDYKFQLKLPVTMPIVADRKKIEQVLINLVNNAIKYSAKGSTVIIQCLQQANQALVAVKDQGIGIAPENIKKLFDRFYRVNNVVTANVTGYGIGLHLVKNIITAHKGKLAVTSRLNHGSEFYFTLSLSS